MPTELKIGKIKNAGASAGIFYKTYPLFIDPTKLCQQNQLDQY